MFEGVVLKKWPKAHPSHVKRQTLEMKVIVLLVVLVAVSNSTPSLLDKLSKQMLLKTI